MLPTSAYLLDNLRLVVLVGMTLAACRSQPNAGGAPPAGDAGRRDGQRDGVVRSVAAPAPRDARAPEADEGQPGVEGLSPEQRAAAQRFEAKYCRKGACCATGAWVFADRRGRRLAVIAIESNEPCLLPQKPRKASKRDQPEEDEGSEDERHACRKHWLVDVDGAKPPIHVSLAEECDADKWEGGADVDLKTRTFSTGGHSLYNNRQTDEHTVIGLDPLRLIETSAGVQSLDELHDVKWNWDEIAGQINEGYNYCPGKVPPDAGVSNDRDSPELETLSVVIPSASLPAGFVDGGWRTTGLGRCAAQVDGTRGFAIRGDKGTAADSTMRVLFASHDTFFVEVTDDRFVGASKSWVKEDHLEIWSAPNPPACVDPTAKSPALQWGIRLRDGAVFPGFGAPEARPAVEIARAGKAVRLKITFDAETLTNRPFTAVYSDSDDGVHQKRLIATSSLEYGKWWTLGEMPDDEKALTCKVERGVLVPRRPPFVEK